MTNNSTLNYLEQSFPLLWKSLGSSQIKDEVGVLILSPSPDDPMQAVEIYPALSEDEVKSIESKLNYSLHPEFRELLLHFNGGRFFEDINIWGIKKIYSKSEYLDQYFDLIKDQTESKQGWEHRTWRAKDLVVGDDGGGNLFVLNNDNGKVTYLDNEFPDEYQDDEHDSIITYLDQFIAQYFQDVISQG